MSTFASARCTPSCASAAPTPLDPAERSTGERGPHTAPPRPRPKCTICGESVERGAGRWVDLGWTPSAIVHHGCVPAGAKPGLIASPVVTKRAGEHEAQRRADVVRHKRQHDPDDELVIPDPETGHEKRRQRHLSRGKARRGR